MNRVSLGYCGRHEAEPAVLMSRFWLLLRMRRIYVACEAWNEWNAQNAILPRTFGPSITRNLITGVLTYLSRETYAEHTSNHRWS